MNPSLLWSAPRYLLVAAMSLLFAGGAGAQSESQVTSEQIERAGTLAGNAADAKEEGKPSFVALPIPLSDPTVGTGITLIGAALYNPNHSARPWVTGGGAMFTNNGSRAFGAAQQASFWQDRLRVIAFVGQADLNLRFYGVGAAAGDRQISVPIGEDGRILLLQGLYGVTEDLFVGLRVLDLRLKTTVDPQELNNALGISLPPLELDHRTTTIGPALDYDTRDNQFTPSQGSYATLRIGFASPDLGSDTSYRNLRATFAHYWTVRPQLIVAGRLSTCAVEGNVPFTELCLYGTSNDLRGYTGGQYRDKAMYAAQAEARWRFGERFGAVLFAGTGAVARTFSELWSVRQLPSAGFGIRWLASTTYKVNVSADLAFTRNDQAAYFYIGEAF
jgi:outer membrane protein assembly factor BamA